MADRIATGDVLSIPAQGSAYVVKEGDTLRNIAMRVYGSEMDWPLIWEANPQVTNPDLIYPGLTIAVPLKVLEIPAPAAIGELTDDTPLPAAVAPAVKKLKLLADGAPVIDAEVTLEGQLLNCIQGQFTYGFDTFAPCWNVTVPWDPGKDAVFDKNSARGSYANSTIKLNGELKGTGYLYIRSPSISTAGITKQLTFFSRTKNILDSSLATKETDYPKITLKDYAVKMGQAVGGFAVTCQTDTGNPFENIQRVDGAKMGQMLQNLAAQRGFFVSADEKGNIVLRKMISKNNNSAADIFYGGDIALDWRTTYDDTKRFRRYGVYSQTGDGEFITDAATDEEVPATIHRELLAKVDNIDKDNAKTAAAWFAMKIYLQSIELQVKVSDWLDNRGKIWEPMTLVNVRSWILETSEIKPYIIRTVDFSWSAAGRECTLHLIPATDVKNGKVIH